MKSNRSRVRATADEADQAETCEEEPVHSLQPTRHDPRNARIKALPKLINGTPVNRFDLKSMSTAKLWFLFEKLGATLTEKIVAKKSVLEDRLRQLNHRFPIEGTSDTVKRRPYPNVFPKNSELRVRNPRAGEHGCATTEVALAVMRSMAGRWSDEHIAASLNRMGLPTGQGKTWTAHRVASFAVCALSTPADLQKKMANGSP
jgi:hypothetical protein